MNENIYENHRISVSVTYSDRNTTLQSEKKLNIYMKKLRSLNYSFYIMLNAKIYLSTLSIPVYLFNQH